MSERKKSNLDGSKDRLEGAPEWYGTPLDQLDFEWSREEKLELERYCQKIHKNIAEEEMTPLERFNATFEGKDKDRLMIENQMFNVFAARTLDSAADAVKPRDVHLYPKLLVKSQLATVARFGLDFPFYYGLFFSDELWGGRAKIIEYGAPVMVGERPIKTMEDLENLEIPDPYKNGGFPGYLWACREIRRVMDEFGLSEVMPLAISCCGGPLGGVLENMMGHTPFIKALKNEPELCKKALDIYSEWLIRYGKAVAEVSHPNLRLVCEYQAIPPKGNEWLADYWKQIGNALSPQGYVWTSYSFPSTTQWFPVMAERGALAPDAYQGGYAGFPMDLDYTVDFHRDHDRYISFGVPNSSIFKGKMEVVDELAKKISDKGKTYKKFAFSLLPVDYWTPQDNLDAALAILKKYAKL